MEFKYLNTTTLQKHFSPDQLRDSYQAIMGRQSNWRESESSPMRQGTNVMDNSQMMMRETDY